MKIIVQDNQSIYDIALQYAGSLEAVIDILEANGKANTTLLIGEELVIPIVLVAKVANFFNDKGLIVATSSTPLDVDEWIAPEGLDRKVEISVNGDLLEVVQAPRSVNIKVVNSNNDAIPTSVVDGNVVVFGLPCPESEVSVGGHDWTVSSGNLLNISIRDSNNHSIATTKDGDVLKVSTLPCAQDVISIVPYKESDDYVEIIVIADNEGVVNVVETIGLADVVFKVNNIVKTLPFNVIVGDVFKCEFNLATNPGQIKIIGKYA